MKTVLPSPGRPSTNIIPPLFQTFSTISTALISSFALPKNLLCSAPWCISCSVSSDVASNLSWACHMKDHEVLNLLTCIIIYGK